MARFVPRGFMHLSGLISFNCSIERRSRTLSWRWRHTQSGYVSASRSTLVRIFGGRSIARWQRTWRCLTCSVVFAGRTTVLRLLLGERVSRVRECRVSRGRASSGRRRLVFRLGYVEFDRTSVSVLYLLLSICAAARHLGRPVGKCAACKDWVRDVHADRLGVSRQLLALQVGRAQRMGLFAVRDGRQPICSAGTGEGDRKRADDAHGQRATLRFLV